MSESKKVEEKIEKYIDCLKQFNETTNIYSKNAYDRLPFHIQDSVNIADMIGDAEVKVVDMGSGSGLPSIIIAICNPNNQVVAVESKSRKRKFLEIAKKELQLENYEVYEGDIQHYLAKNKQDSDIYTAKAFAALEKIEWILKPKRKSSYVLIVPYSESQYNAHEKDHEKHIQIDENDMSYYYMVREHVAEIK